MYVGPPGLSYFTDCMDSCEELSTDENNLLLPEEFTLHPVYPNPFNPTTDIGFSLEYAGSYIITWNAYQFPSGIYFIYLQAGKQIDIQKVTLLK